MGTPLEIVIPDIGVDEEVEVVEVLVKAGDVIQVDDPLVTLESDKASLDVPSTASGRVSKVSVTTGDRVRMGSVVLLLDSDAETDTPAALSNANNGTASTPAAAIAAPTATAHNTADEPTRTVSNGNHNKSLSAVITNDRQATVNANINGGATSIDVQIPDVGTDESVEVIEILVNIGDQVSVDDPLITLESDKATMDVPCPAAGSVEQLHVSIGERVRKGDRVLSLQATSPESQASQQTPTTPDTTAQSATDVTAAAASSVSATAEPRATDVPVREPAHVREPVHTPERSTSDHVSSVAAPDIRSTGQVPHASPSVRRFARELGADLAHVSGTGRKGRITVEDVQSWVKSQLSGAAVGQSAGGIPPVPSVDFSKFGDTEQVKMSRIKRLSGPHLQRAWLNAPHVTHHDEADITDLEQFRQSMKEDLSGQGIKLTPLVFIMRALVSALKEFPQFNASLSEDGESMIYKKYFNIGIAVDTPEGLVVPVVQDVDRKGYIELAKDLAEISQRARDGALKPADIQGGCISISSLGSIGGTAFTPIINVPEVAILGVAQARMKPVWDGEKFVARRLLPLDLSYDHRAIDGAEAARFVSFLVNGLGDIRRLSM